MFCNRSIENIGHEGMNPFHRCGENQELGFDLQKFGQQTPRRWGWGTPLKKRAATRMIKVYFGRELCQHFDSVFFMKRWDNTECGMFVTLDFRCPQALTPDK